MSEQGVFGLRGGAGLLVLAGGAVPAGDVRAAVIARAAADGALAVLVLDNLAAADAVLSDMQELGAPAGYLVDVMTEDDDTLRREIGEAGIVVVSSAALPDTVRSALMGAAVEGLATAYEHGAVILAEGSAAAAFGGYLLDGAAVRDGLGWLQNGCIVPGVTSAADVPGAQQVIAQHPAAVLVSIGAGSALALGSGGRLEMWGAKQITIALGSAYTGE